MFFSKVPMFQVSGLPSRKKEPDGERLRPALSGMLEWLVYLPMTRAICTMVTAT